MELKIFLFWLAFTCFMWVSAKVHYVFSGKHFTWKYFKDDYSYFGIAHYVSLVYGCAAIGFYLFIQVVEWWFNK